MSITATDVKALRDKTNAPMMECKAALTEAGGDMEKATELLRKKMKDIQVKRGDRETAEGRVAVYVDPALKIGAIVEVRCESAPVAKAEQFIKLAGDIARQIVQQNPANVETLLAQKLYDGSGKTVNERIADVIGLIRENMKVQRFTRLTGLVGEYSHHDGTLGVLVLVDGAQADPLVLKDVCMHIAARNPVSAVKEDVPAEVIAKEKEIARDQFRPTTPRTRTSHPTLSR